MHTSTHTYICRIWICIQFCLEVLEFVLKHYLDNLCISLQITETREIVIVQERRRRTTYANTVSLSNEREWERATYFINFELFFFTNGLQRAIGRERKNYRQKSKNRFFKRIIIVHFIERKKYSWWQPSPRFITDSLP